MTTLLEIYWNVKPQIIESPFPLRWYSILFAVSFILGYVILKKMYKNDGVPIEWVDDALMYVMIGTILGARFGEFLFYHPQDLFNNPLEVILPFEFSPEFRFTGFQGLSSHGAAIGITIAIWLYSKRVTKKSILWSLDRVVVGIALAGCFIRFGNFMNHEIIGKPSDLPWAVVLKYHYEEIPTPRHPSQLYESFTYLLIWCSLMFTYWKKEMFKKEGFIFGQFLVLMFTARFFLEFFKENQSSFENDLIVNMGQLLSIPFVLTGLFFIFRSNENTSTV